MGRHITILGMGDSARSRRHDIHRYVRGEVWGLNNGYLTFPEFAAARGFARIYELHGYDYLKTYCAGHDRQQRQVDHFASLHTLGCPIVTGQKLPVIHNQEQIDWEGVFAEHGLPVYFLGSPSVMLAMALWEHKQGQTIDQIDSWGIDTADPSHQQQRASWAFWVGRCLENGIRFGGTALGFMTEPDNDEGLAGVREQITARLKTARQEGPVTDYIVATFATPGKYTELAERLGAQCKALKLPFYVVTVTPPDGASARGWTAAQKPRVIRELLETHGKPILFMDADDELLARPTFPECDVGWIQNPEKKTIATHLQIACFGLFAPTKPGFAWLDDWQAEIDRGTTDHRAMQCVWTRRYHRSNKHGKYLDITPHVRGAIKQNASPLGYRPTATIT